MAFIFNPSLQHIAIVKIVTTLWIQDDIRYIIEKPFFNNSSTPGSWDEAGNKMCKKVKMLSLSKYVESEVLNAIMPIGYEILFWRNYHERFMSAGIATKRTFRKNFHKLCWTSQGTVDRKRTAEVWIRDEDLDVITRYELACMYCLENDIRKLWNQLPDIDKKSLYHVYDVCAKKSKLVFHWTFYLNEEFWDDEKRSEKSLNRYAFQEAANEGNKVATEFFFVKLTPEEKKLYLEKVTTRSLEPRSETANMSLDRENLPETSCFLLSQMDEGMLQKQIFNYPYEILLSLLSWPRQIFFLETAKRMWGFLNTSDYSRLLFTDIYQYITHYKSCNFREIFNGFWQQGPLNHKRCAFVQHTHLYLLFSALNIIHNTNLNLWILKDSTTEEKLNLIFTAEGQLICKFMIKNKRWNSLESFIRECISSKDALTDLRKILKDDSSLASADFNIKNELNKIFKLAEDGIKK